MIYFVRGIQQLYTLGVLIYGFLSQFFVSKYLHGQKVAPPEPASPDKAKKGMSRPNWKGLITKVVDIEENIWSPR